MMYEAFVSLVRRFYETHRQELFTYALLLTRRRAVAEDVVHTVFCNLLQRGRAPRDLRPYVFRSIRNAALDQRRRDARETPHDSLFAQGNGRSEVESWVGVEETLDALGTNEREAVVLKVFDGMTLKEIAKLRRVSINTAASWYRRGIEKLRTRVEKEKNDEEC